MDYLRNCKGRHQRATLSYHQIEDFASLPSRSAPANFEGLRRARLRRHISDIDSGNLVLWCPDNLLGGKVVKRSTEIPVISLDEPKRRRSLDP
jgi:hypothetical protein